MREGEWRECLVLPNGEFTNDLVLALSQNTPLRDNENIGAAVNLQESLEQLRNEARQNQTLLRVIGLSLETIVRDLVTRRLHLNEVAGIIPPFSVRTRDDFFKIAEVLLNSVWRYLPRDACINVLNQLWQGRRELIYVPANFYPPYPLIHCTPPGREYLRPNDFIRWANLMGLDQIMRRRAKAGTPIHGDDTLFKRMAFRLTGGENISNTAADPTSKFYKDIIKTNDFPKGW
jgi:hypothetical protein